MITECKFREWYKNIYSFEWTEQNKQILQKNLFLISIL